MRRIGYSTGALAFGDFKRGLEMLRGRDTDVVELSALREHELLPLVSAASQLDLKQFRYIAIHAPSFIEPSHESEAVGQLRHFGDRGWPVVLHPDAVCNWNLWEPFGRLLLVENMDRRKDIGRTADDLEKIFERVPDAGLCFDVGHARQCDTSMTEAYRILKRFRDRLRQIHLSEVTTRSVHERLSSSFIVAVREIAEFIPENVPVILETPVSEDQIDTEIERARTALSALTGNLGSLTPAPVWV
jgi:hypothetical protein